MMEFYFNEEKCIENNIDINKVYEFLDEKIVEEGRMTKLNDGIYQGEGYFKIRLERIMASYPVLHTQSIDYTIVFIKQEYKKTDSE